MQKFSGESADDSTIDGETRITPSEKQAYIEPYLVTLTCIGQQENNLTSISRHAESYDGKGSIPHDPTVRDLPHGDNINVEPVLKTLMSMTVKRSSIIKKVTCTPPNTQQSRSTSSQVVAVKSTAKNECSAVQNQLVLRSMTAIIAGEA